MRRRCAFTLIEVLVVLAVLATLLSLLVPAVQSVRENARRAECETRLHNLGIGLHAYHAVHDVLPPGSLVLGPAFRTLSGWGWGAMLLPYVEERPLSEQIDFDLGTAVGRNRKLIGTPLELWRCPSDPAGESVGVTAPDGTRFRVAGGNYLGVEGMLAEMSHVRFSDVTDGTSSTLMLGERLYREEVAGGSEGTSSWCGTITFEDSYVFDSIPHQYAAKQSMINLVGASILAFGSRHPGGASFAFGDARVRFLSENMSGDVFYALGTRDGNEAVTY